MSFWVKKLRTRNDVWAHTLSYCKSHELFLQKFGLFFLVIKTFLFNIYQCFGTKYDLFDSSRSLLMLFNNFWAILIRRFFWSKLRNFTTNFVNTSYMPKKSVKIAQYEPTDILTSLATSLIAIRRLSNTIFDSASTFSSVVDILGRPGRISSSTPFRFSNKSLYHLSTLFLLKVDLLNAISNISSTSGFLLFIFNIKFHFFRYKPLRLFKTN